MSGADRPGEPSAQQGDEVTASRGTPAPVDVSVDTRAVTAVVVLLAGPVISSVHFMVVYLTVEAGCTGDGPGLDAFDPPVPTVVTLVATVVAALACLATAGWALVRWRRVRRMPPQVRDDALVDREPLAFGGALLSLLGFTAVLFVGLPALVLGACA